MDTTDFGSRLSAVEQRVEAWEGRFDDGIASLTAQISQLREDVLTGDERLERTFREEIRAGDEETRRALREEIRRGDEETRHYMRVLHEEVIERIARLGENR